MMRTDRRGATIADAMAGEYVHLDNGRVALVHARCAADNRAHRSYTATVGRPARARAVHRMPRASVRGVYPMTEPRTVRAVVNGAELTSTERPCAVCGRYR